jgi:hypothetical protein
MWFANATHLEQAIGRLRRAQQNLRVDEIDVDIDIVVRCSSTNNRANALRSATTTADNATEVSGAYADFKKDLVTLARTR